MTQKKRLGLCISINLYEEIVKLAEYQGKTINSTCIDLFWAYFENQAKQKKPHIADKEDIKDEKKYNKKHFGKSLGNAF